MKREDLLGAWSLESWEIAYSDGRASTFPYGRDALGLLMYTPDGHMVATISRAARAGLSSEDLRSVPAEERASAFNDFFSYAGQWSIDGNTVSHQVDLSLNPNFVGTTQVRQAVLDGSKLMLSAAEDLGARELTREHRLVWLRAPASTSDGG